MDEFALIDAIVLALGDAASGPWVELGPGDDCAITRIPPDAEVVTTVDALLEGVHFPAGCDGRLIGHRALAVVVSDLAAMGATPTHAVIAAALPSRQESWLLEFAKGLGDAARAFGVAIVGGNLAQGPLNVSITALGFVTRGTALRRRGARPGERVFVSGCIGAAAAALQGGIEPAIRFESVAAMAPDAPLRRYFMPVPRLTLGGALRGIASAAIDVSDGLLADLGHLCRASEVGARIALEQIPLAEGVDARSAICAGDDYELLFTVPKAALPQLTALTVDVPVTAIGEIVAGSAVQVFDEGRPIELTRTGFRHFA